VSGHEQGPSRFEKDPSNPRMEQPPREPPRVDPHDPRARAAARVALDRTGPRDPAQVRQEREARVAPELGRTALSKDVERTPLPGRDARPDEPKRDRPEGRDG
jgi:hypothetical protein